ncbi:MAG: F0F1 ATP synthase subunit B, partial [Acidobacteriota bacterium]
FVLKRVAWKPMLSMLDEREKSIRESLEGAERARKEAAASVEEQKRFLERARKEGMETLNRHQREAEALRQDLTSKAREEADRLLADGRRQIEQETRAAVKQIRREAVDLALSAAEKAIGASLDERNQRRLIEEHIDSLHSIEKNN